MNTHPKTDECIKMLGDAQLAITPLLYDGISNFDKGRTNKIINFQNRIIAMLNYRLMPSCVITIPDNADKETARENRLLHDIRDFEAFWYAMKNYPLVTVNDLENEFWSICPDLGSLNKFLDVMLVKFDDVNYNYDTDIDTIKKQYGVLDKRVEAGVISEEEANTMFWNIHFIADEYNLKMKIIRKVYKTFRKMANPQQTKEKSQIQPPQLTQKLTPEKIEKLKQYFLPAFKGIHKKFNYFEEHLIPALEIERTLTDYAIIAHIIHESNAINVYKKKSHFSAWYSEFCKIMDINKTTYKPSQIKNNANYSKIAKEFAYLNLEY